jgi:hypothetical protein
VSDEHKGVSFEAIVAGALTSPGLDDLAADYAELGLDGVLDGDTVSEVPLVKSLVAIVRVGIAIRDRLFCRKLFDFLVGFRGISEWERRDMVSRLEADPTYGRRVGEHLTELLDRIESVKKPLMVARVFQAYADKSIDAMMLHRLCGAVERIPVFEIPTLRRFCETIAERRQESTPTLQNLQGAGLLNASAAYGGMSFEENEVAKVFLALGLDQL